MPSSSDEVVGVPAHSCCTEPGDEAMGSASRSISPLLFYFLSPVGLSNAYPHWLLELSDLRASSSVACLKVKVLNITHYQRNANQNHNEVPSHAGQWLLSKSLQTINAGEGVEKREPSYTVGGNAN